MNMGWRFLRFNYYVVSGVTLFSVMLYVATLWRKYKWRAIRVLFSHLPEIKNN